VSGVRFYHKQLAIQPKALSSFPVTCLLRAADLTMRSAPKRKLPITPQLLYKLVKLCDHIGPLGPAMKVALTFGYFAMLRQSNLAPPTPAKFDPSRHTCRGDVMAASPGLVLLLRWTKTIQTMDNLPLVPLPHLHQHPADPVAAYHQLLASSPTLHEDQPLLTVQEQGVPVIVTSTTLSQTLKTLLTALDMDPSSYSLHSLRRGGATTAYLAGVDQLHVKRHGTWKSGAFWDYVTSPLVADSPVAAALAASLTC
jgi:hypothetical protein